MQATHIFDRPCVNVLARKPFVENLLNFPLVYENLHLSMQYFLQRMRGVNFFLFSSRRRHTSSLRDWSSDVCSSDLLRQLTTPASTAAAASAHAATMAAQ